LNDRLVELWNSGATEWDKPVKALVDIIYEKYDAEKKRVLRKEGRELSVANYVKSRTCITDLLDVTIPKTIGRTLAATLKGA